MARIVLIDDEVRLVRTLERLLVAEGHTVHAATDFDGAEGVLHPGTFDVLFSDILLEGLHGTEILRRVRERGSDEPVVLMTGAPNADSAEEAVRLWAFDYLVKPVGKFALLTVLARALRYVELVRHPFDMVLRRLRCESASQGDSSAALVELADRLDALAGCARRLAAVRGPLVPADIDASACEVVEQALQRWRRLFGRAEAERVAFARPATDLPLHGDPAQLADALLFVLRDAADAGGFDLPVQVSVGRANREHVALDVSGRTGRLRTAPAAATPLAGRGEHSFGLPAARRIVEAHGGRIEVVAGADCGSFRILLPSVTAS